MPEENNKLKIVTIEELLEENLTIPGYQRPYRWSREAAVTLVVDSYRAFINKVPEYRMGSVVLHSVTGANEEAELNIVDGQQRLTTISIMFFVFYKITKNEAYKNQSKLLKVEYNELSNEAVVNNLNVIERKVKEIADNQLKAYIQYILKKCTMVKIITESEQEAFQFFDSQNSRGRTLAPHDLLKAYHLREMQDESDSTKAKTIDSWEEKNQSELENLFADQLYPLVRWYKSMDGLNYGTKKIKTFKGIRKDNRYNFSVYNRAANLYIERFNAEGMYELTSGSRINQFQLTQPIIAGKRFFEYSLHYAELYEELDKLVAYKFNDEQIVRKGAGDGYVYNMFINVLMFYVDRFSMEALTDGRLFFFYKWAYSLRVLKIAIYRESVNKYAQGKYDKLNNGLKMFSLIAELQEPMELDTAVLEEITEDKFKANKERYQTMYNTIRGGGLSGNDF